MTSPKTKRALARRFTAFAAILSMAVPAAGQFVLERALLDRITPGYTRKELAVAVANGFQATLDQQLLLYLNLSDAEGPIPTKWPAIGMTPQQIQTVYMDLQKSGPVDEELQEVFIWRLAMSERGFFERMARFWANHFNADVNKRVVTGLMPWFDRNVNRRTPFGQFRPIAHASTGLIGFNPGGTPNYHPAGPMALLHYLDNNVNVCTVPQENYARELLELHLMGNRNLFTGAERQGYTEVEIRDLAKMLTGWTFNIQMGAGANRLMYYFDATDHCNTGGPYPFLTGPPIPVDPVEPSEGWEAVDRAVDHVDPVTGEHYCALYLAEKLTRAFLTDAPLENLHASQIVALRRAVNDAVVAFGADGDITAMLQAILTKQNITEVLTPPAGFSPMWKYKSPWHYMTSVLRALEADIDITGSANGAAALNCYLSGSGNVGNGSSCAVTTNLGQEPFAYGPPIGYPEAIAVWCQNQPNRWEFAWDMLEGTEVSPGVWEFGNIDDVSVDVPALYAQLPGGFNRANCAQQADDIVAGGALVPSDVAIIQGYINQLAPTVPDEVAMWKALFLTILAPGFNLY